MKTKPLKAATQSEKGLGLIALTIQQGLTSPNVPDSNCESANIVDVVQFLANATAKIASHLGGDPDEAPDRNGVVSSGTVAYAINRVADAIFTQVEMQDSLHRMVEAINSLAAAIREKT